MNRETQEQYINARSQLTAELEQYNAVADEIAKRYDPDDIKQFNKMCDEQEAIREQMGINILENKLFELENLLLKEFEKYCMDMGSTIHIFKTNNNLELKQLFDEGIKDFKTRKMLIELSLQA